MSKELLPLLVTRGAVIFPKQLMTIEVGRKASLSSVNSAINNNQYLCIVSQIDLAIDEPNQNDIYTVGTISRIKNVRNKWLI